MALLRAAREQNTLLIAPTGAGKTLAGFLPTLVDSKSAPNRRTLHTLYISPLKALAVDVERNLSIPVAEMGLSRPDRDAHGRHLRRETPAPAPAPARHSADDAGTTGASPRQPRRRASLRLPPPRRFRRIARHRRHETGRSFKPWPRPAARHRAATDGDRPFRDGARSGRAAALAGAAGNAKGAWRR